MAVELKYKLEGLRDDERLCEAIRGFPCLWQVNSIIYRDVMAKQNAWNKVATMVSNLCRLPSYSNKLLRPFH